ncbi:MAG: lipid-A-disaccharide synthase [Desulfobacterales bacterium]|nr:lipid-A-disaccharide synthase [Desulfobacterales bacterium]
MRDQPINGKALDRKRKIMIIAGEASGDLHGANLVRAMRSLNPDLSFFGIGGNALGEAGVQIKVDNSKIAVVGLSEALSKLKILLSALRIAKENLKRIRPDLLIVIDFPDFNLRVATVAKKLGIPVMYYISPQIWAWRTGRVKKIKKVVDHMVVIFPFEVDFYKKRNVPVTFVGHPLLDSMRPRGTHEKAEDLRGNGFLVGLLPGSRNEEVTRLLPTMVKTAAILSERIPGIRFAIPAASSVDRTLVETIAQEGAAKFLVLSDRLRDILDEATLLITASGTVTLEAAIAGTPMIIVYKVSGLSYWVGKRLIRVKHIGLANLVAGRSIVPELIQHEVSAEKIAHQALRILRDENKLAEMRHELRRVAQSLGPAGASKRAAEVAMRLLSRQ